MDHNFRSFDSHKHYNHLVPTSSFIPPVPARIGTYPFTNRYYDVADGLWTGRSVGPADMREAVQRELEKEIIRNEILAEETERRRILHAEVRRELMIEYEMTAAARIGPIPSPLMLGQIEPLRLHSNRFQPENRGSMTESYGSSVAVEAVSVPLPVPIRRRTQSECIGLGKCSGSKRKAPEPPTKEDYRCAVCNITATSARGLQEHLSGKKHQTKVAGTEADGKKIVTRRKKGKKTKRASKKGKKHRKRG